MKVSFLVLDLFVESMTTDLSEKKFSVLAPEVRSFLKCIVMKDATAAKDIYEIVDEKAVTRTRSLMKTVTGRILNLILVEIRARQF